MENDRLNARTLIATAASLIGSAALFCAFFPTAAYAQSLGNFLCDLILNNMAAFSAVASLGVVLLGVGAALGKVTWKQAVLVVVGISAMFGFATIASTIVGTTDINGDGVVNGLDTAATASMWCAR